ncbi:glutathione S-transferase family protein [Streptomyces rhizosphaerihabitans]|uniref:glutathione S-transferase family protein n=1 Tax=Streptomyces rhizosphaerihabitans TaxID=1266770 RepID=UPI0021C20E63|nr:glutathione S-transferase C-terminal domain-containing protein [Streptomyces rhizosphaerihabitans]MCT9007444.1 cell envelope biogenesis protein OmpA [Streptomyces rhizosphaerihabitans]
MPETASRTSGTANSRPCDQISFPSSLRLTAATTTSALPHRAHSRIGVGLAGGFYPAPHRYELYLSESCSLSQRIAITLELLGLKDSVATTVLAHPAGTPDAFASLRRAYEATEHHYDGPLTAPALCDRWSGRIVSNHTPDILRDLAGLLSGHTAGRPSTLCPPALTADIEALRDLLDRDVTPAAEPSGLSAALELLDCQLAAMPYVLGEDLTAADVDVWVALTRLDPSDILGTHPRLQDYVRRLGDQPAFRGGSEAVPVTAGA